MSHAKLTHRQVANIRRARGLVPMRVLAVHYGVSTTTIHNVYTNKIKAHALRRNEP